MPKPWYSIKAAAAGSDTAEVSILEPISAWYGVGAYSFLNEIKALAAPNLKLSINSLGGNVVEGLAIYNGLKASGKNIEVHVLGIAASIASYIAMAADKIVMPANTLMVVHKPWNDTGGNADAHRAAADQLDTIENLLLPAYMARFKGTEDELRAVLKADDILTAEQCLAYGFCDEIVGEIAVNASFDVEMLPPAARALFVKASAEGDAAAAAAAEAARIVAANAAAAAGALPSPKDIGRIAAEHGVEAHAGVLALDPNLKTIDAVTAAAKDMAEVVALCGMTNSADRAADFIAARTPLADVRAALSKAQADLDAASRVDTARRSLALQGSGRGGKSEAEHLAEFSPLALWKDINTAAAKRRGE